MKHHLPLVFDSDRLPAAQRMEFVREEFGRRVLQVEIDSIGELPYSVCLSGESFGNVRIASVTNSPVCHSRGRRLASLSDDSLGYVIPLRGRYVAGHRGANHSVSPGQVMILSNTIEGMVSSPAGGTFLTIIVPRQQLLEALQTKEAIFGDRLPYSSESLSMLHAFVRFVGSRSARLTAGERVFAGHQMVSLLAIGLDGSKGTISETCADSLFAARCAAILAEIDAHFNEAWFGIEVCAARHGLSVRYIQVLLQQNGMSFVEEIKRRRLDMAKRQLIDPANRDIRITDVAYDCGYRDISHFNRQFRAAFGDSPSGFRSSRVSG